MIDFRSVREQRASSFDFIQVRIASPEEIRGPKDPKERERLEEATINDLGGRTMSQETRDIHHAIRDFLASAAKELAEREQTAVDNQITFHTAWVDDEAQSASKRTEYRAALKQLEKRRAMEPADLLNDHELPALAGMLGKKSEADIDAASA